MYSLLLSSIVRPSKGRVMCIFPICLHVSLYLTSHNLTTHALPSAPKARTLLTPIQCILQLGKPLSYTKIFTTSDV